MSDVIFETHGFWFPEDIVALSGINGLECSTGDGYVIVHNSPSELTPAKIAAIRAALLSEVKPTAVEREAIREAATEVINQEMIVKLKAIAQSAVGVTVPNLTTGQLKAMLAILLWRAGGIDKDLKVNPLANWVKVK